MAYTPTNWVCGDTITAEKLNKLENGLAECCSGGDVGYSCSEGWVTLTDESVTTAIEGINPAAIGELTYSEPITADTIKVIFNGTEYTCDKQIHEELGNVYFYYGTNVIVPIGGTIDWTQYPFAIVVTEARNNLSTETAGTYQVKIEAYEKTVETSECFDMARGYSCIESVTTYVDETATFA